MPLSEQAFIVDPNLRNAEGEHVPLTAQITSKCVEKFGSGAKFVDHSKQKGTTIRYLKRIGMNPQKRGGKWYVTNSSTGKELRLMWAKVSVPTSFLIDRATKQLQKQNASFTREDIEAVMEYLEEQNANG